MTIQIGNPFTYFRLVYITYIIDKILASFSQVCRFAGLQVCRFAGLQVRAMLQSIRVERLPKRDKELCLGNRFGCPVAPNKVHA